MKKYLSLCLIILFPAASQAQITMTPSATDFCTNQLITFSCPAPPPNSYYEWQWEDFSSGWGGIGGNNVMSLGTSSPIYMNSGSLGTCAIIRLLEKDLATGTIIGSDSRFIGSSAGGGSVPWQFSTYSNSCGVLEVPPVLDPMGAWPYRWAMWYKNGVATGVSSYQIYNLTDSAWYEYKVRLNCGDTLSTGLFYLWRPSAPDITAQGPATFCTGDSVTLVASTSVAIDAWYRNGVAIAGTTGKTSIKAYLDGQYYARGKYSNGSGWYCFPVSDTIQVTVNPGAFITGNNQACNGDSIQLTCTAAPSYVWRRNGNIISGANTQSIWVKTSGNYTVSTTGLTCNNSIVKTVTFYANPTITISPNGSQSLCTGSALTLSAGGNNITSYQWLRNGNVLSGTNVSALTITSAGTYRCIVSNVIGCSRTSAGVSVSSASGNVFPQKTLVLQPGSQGKDSYITSAFGNFSTNFGGAPTMEISNWRKYFRTAERGFIEFDLSQLPPNSPIISATLKLWVDTIDSTALSYAPNSLYLKRCVQPWQENTISWNYYPDSSDFQFTAVPASGINSNSFIYPGITNQVKHWSYNPSQNFGLFLQMGEVNQQLTWISIPSSDHPDVSLHPKLTIKYYYADNLASGTTNLCTGQSVTLSTNTGSFTRQWYKNGQPIAGATGSTYAASTAGDYYVVLTAASGCTVKSLTQKVTLNATPVPNLTPADTVILCSGSSITLKADSLPGYSFQWKKNGNNISGATQSSYTTTQSGTYIVRVTSNCGLTAADTVVVNKIFNPAATITAGGPTTFCVGQSVLLTANTFSGVSYQWYRNGILITPNGTNQTWNATSGGDYWVVETANGCSKTSNIITVVVNCRQGEYSLPASGINVYPVPVGEQASIDLNGYDPEGVSFELCDISGKMLLRFRAEGNITIFSRRGLASGMYFLRTLDYGTQVAVNRLLLAD